MKTLRNYNKTLIGHNDNEPIYLSPPSWDCGWYWGFGYLGNKNCHYHFDGLNKKVDFHAAIIEHFGDTLQIQPSKTWEFAELMKTFYNLKTVCDVLGRGDAHLTTNPCKDIIINTKEVERINNTVLPSVYDAIYKILENYSEFKENIIKIIQLNLEGGVTETVSFMNENGIKTDDLKVAKKITSHDFTVIHSKYWETYHANKK